MIEEASIECPYCGEAFVAVVDCSAGEQCYVEDCQVCCRPIEFRVRTGGSGDLLGVETRRDDD